MGLLRHHCHVDSLFTHTYLYAARWFLRHRYMSAGLGFMGQAFSVATLTHFLGLEK